MKQFETCGMILQRIRNYFSFLFSISELFIIFELLKRGALM